MMESNRTSITLPDLGAESVQIVQWLVEPAAEVLSGDRILELLADGVLFHLSADVSGRLVRQERHRGCIVKTGETLGWIEPVSDPASS